MPQSSSLDSGKNETPSSDDIVCVLPALTPSLNRVETSLTFPSPLATGEATVPSAGDAPALQHFSKGRGDAEATARPRLADQEVAHASGPPRRARTLALRYCTVTSVPTGISEKNLRAVSAGNRMQPCDAG